jgi:pilus assembly protein Flp/PilA
MMHMLKTYVEANLHREEGATAVEYGIMVVLIAVVIIAGVGLLGTNLDGLFSSVAGTVGGAGGGDGGS